MMSTSLPVFPPAAAVTRHRQLIVKSCLPMGFTLLELLVALAVFAVLSAIAYSGLRSVLSTQTDVEAAAQRLAEVQMAFYFLESDIEQIIPRSIRDEYGQEQPAVKSGGPTEELLTLTRTGWDNPLGQLRSNLKRLTYRVEDSRLLRLNWDSLDRGSYAEPHQTVLLNRVKEVKIRFLDNQNAWQNDWPPPSQGELVTDSLPLAVELSVKLSDWGEIIRLFLLQGLSNHELKTP